MNNKNTKPENPWKGLNYYVEGDVLYGRSRDIENLSQYIINNSQTILYGKSGIGKTSIINAGIFPIARKHGMIPVGIRLDHSNSVSYISQIKNAIHDARVVAIERVPAIIRENDESLWEYFHRNTFTDENGNTIELLLVFDQFEEIFTLQKDESVKKEFFDHLADLLNGIPPTYISDFIIPQTTERGSKEKHITLDNINELVMDEEDEDDYSPYSSYVQEDYFHIVITLREDYLADLERYTRYIPTMKFNRYALQPINEEQAKDIIMKPREGLVDADVARLIIEKITDRKDFEFGDSPEIEVDSAVLSLFLSELFEAKTGDTISAKLVKEKGGEIISDFYEKAISCISKSAVKYLEDNLLSGNGCRDNMTTDDVKSEGGLTDEDLHILIKEKKLLREFNYANAPRIEFIHDIICPVVKAHREERKQKEKMDEIQKKSRKRLRIIAACVLFAAVLIAALSWQFYEKKIEKKSSEISDLKNLNSQVHRRFIKYMKYDSKKPMLLYMGGGSVYKYIEGKNGLKIDSMPDYPNSIYMPVSTANLWGMIAEEYYNSEERLYDKYYPIFMAADKIDIEQVNKKIPNPKDIKNKMLIMELNLGHDSTTIYFGDNQVKPDIVKDKKNCLLPNSVEAIIRDALGKEQLYTTSKNSGTFASFKRILLSENNQEKRNNDSTFIDTIFSSNRQEFHEKYIIPENQKKYVILGSLYYYPLSSSGKRIRNDNNHMYYVLDKGSNFCLKDMCLYFCAYKNYSSGNENYYEIPEAVVTFLKILINESKTSHWEIKEKTQWDNIITKRDSITLNDVKGLYIDTIGKDSLCQDYIVRFNVK